MNNEIRHDPDGGFTVLPVCSNPTPGDSTMKLSPEFVARVAHQVNRAYCLALGDTSQPLWEDAPQWQRDSAMLGVKLHTENPNASPAASHESWMAQKVAEGWTYGHVKSPETKQHPCIVAFDALPVAQQAKDYIFREVVHALVHTPVVDAPESGDSSDPYGTNGIMSAAPGRPLSFGEKAVGLAFNPSNDPAVHQCKAGFAVLIDQMHDLRTAVPNGVAGRHASVAITMLEDAQMRAVKALTWRD